MSAREKKSSGKGRSAPCGGQKTASRTGTARAENGPRPGNGRDLGVDFARVCAMLGVVMIHATSTHIWDPSSQTFLDRNLAFWLNQIVRFSVPLFMLLSGVSMGLSAPKTEPDGLSGALAFYRRRFLRLFPAYWLWSTLYFLYDRAFDLTTLFSRSYLRNLLWGQAAPHLYFVVVLIQCALTYPLLRRWLDRYPWGFLACAFLSTYAMEQLFAYRRMGLDLIPPFVAPYLWELLPTWIFYFALGMAVTPSRLRRLRQIAAEHRWMWMSAAAVWAVICMLEGRAAGWLDTNRASLIGYGCISLPALLALWSLLEPYRLCRTVTAFLAKHSLTLYFCHVQCLVELRKTGLFEGTAGVLALYAAALAVSIPLSAALDTAWGATKKFFAARRKA